MILKVNISEVYNWDNITGIVTVNENNSNARDDVKDEGTEYEYARGYKDFRNRPFVIEIQLVGHCNKVIFRTSDSDELQEVYNGIIEKIVMCLKGNSSYCDISEYTNYPQLAERVILGEEENY